MPPPCSGPHPRTLAVVWGQETPTWPRPLTFDRSGQGLLAALGPSDAEAESSRKVLCTGSRAGGRPHGDPLPQPGAPQAPTGCGPALGPRPAQHGHARPGGTPAVPRPPGPAGGRSARGRRSQGRRVQRSAGVPKPRCRRRRASVPAPAALPEESEMRGRGPGEERERGGGGAGAGHRGGGRGQRDRLTGAAGQGAGREPERGGAGRSPAIPEPHHAGVGRAGSGLQRRSRALGQEGDIWEWECLKTSPAGQGLLFPFW